MCGTAVHVDMQFRSDMQLCMFVRPLSHCSHVWLHDVTCSTFPLCLDMYTALPRCPHTCMYRRLHTCHVLCAIRLIPWDGACCVCGEKYIYIYICEMMCRSALEMEFTNHSMGTRRIKDTIHIHMWGRMNRMSMPASTRTYDHVMTEEVSRRRTNVSACRSSRYSVSCACMMAL